MSFNALHLPPVPALSKRDNENRQHGATGERRSREVIEEIHLSKMESWISVVGLPHRFQQEANVRSGPRRFIASSLSRIRFGLVRHSVPPTPAPSLAPSTPTSPLQDRFDSTGRAFLFDAATSSLLITSLAIVLRPSTMLLP